MKKALLFLTLISLATTVFADVQPVPGFYPPDILDLSIVVMFVTGIFVVALIALLYILYKRMKK